MKKNRSIIICVAFSKICSTEWDMNMIIFMTGIFLAKLTQARKRKQVWVKDLDRKLERQKEIREVLELVWGSLHTNNKF